MLEIKFDEDRLHKKSNSSTDLLVMHQDLILESASRTITSEKTCFFRLVNFLSRDNPILYKLDANSPYDEKFKDRSLPETF